MTLFCLGTSRPWQFVHFTESAEQSIIYTLSQSARRLVPEKEREGFPQPNMLYVSPECPVELPSGNELVTETAHEDLCHKLVMIRDKDAAHPECRPVELPSGNELVTETEVGQAFHYLASLAPEIG